MGENERKRERAGRAGSFPPNFINDPKKVLQSEEKGVPKKTKKLLTMSPLGAFIAKPPLQITKITKTNNNTRGQIGKKSKK